MLPGLTSFVQELPWAGAQREAWHRRAPGVPGGPVLPHRTHTLVQTTCREDPLHRRRP